MGWALAFALIGAGTAWATVRVSFDAATAGAGTDPTAVSPAWTRFGSPMNNNGAYLLQDNTGNDPTTESGEYLSPTAGAGLMTWGAGQYGIEFRVRPRTDVPNAGSSHYANCIVTWSDSSFNYNLTIDKDTDDNGAGTTGGLRYGGNSMINAVVGINWSTPHTIFVGYRGSAGAFDFYVDGVLAATVAANSMARSGSFARDAIDFGDGTVGQGVDVAAEWYFVRVHDVAAPPPSLHVPFADYDGDGDVDQVDFGAFQKCLTGPGGGVPEGCDYFDRPAPGMPGGDGDIDSTDFDAFAACLSGPEIPADPGCETTTPPATQAYLALYCALKPTLAEVNALIAQCKAQGIGTLVPSLSGSGGSVGFVTPKEQYLPELAPALAGGFDALAVMIQQAHAAGLKVMPSVAIAPVGLVIFGRPEWETKDRNGSPSGSTFAPALAFSYPLARQTKTAMLLDLVNNYAIDGIFLDYLRYPENSNAAHPEYACGFYGYDPPLINQCIATYGFDPRTVAVGSANYNLFNGLRIASVNTWLQEFRTAVAASSRPTINIGGFGDSTLSNDLCAARDWSAWGQNGWIQTLWLGNYVASIATMKQVLADTRQLVGPSVQIQGALTPYNNFLSSNTQMVQAAQQLLLGSADRLWIYREDALTANNMWDGAGLANDKFIRMRKLSPTSIYAYTASTAGAGNEPNDVTPAWALTGSPMTSTGTLLLQNLTVNGAAETGYYQSPVRSGLMTRVDGNYSITFRVRPLTDIVSTVGSTAYANMHVAWSDEVGQFSLAIDRDSDDAGAGTTGGLLAGGTATVTALSGIDWSVAHTIHVVYDGVDKVFYLYLDNALSSAVNATSMQSGASSAALRDRVQFGDSTTAGADGSAEWYSIAVNYNVYVP